MTNLVKVLLDRGLRDWNQVVFATDYRSASDTLKIGATDYNGCVIIESELAPKIAYQCVLVNPGRHMQLTTFFGSIALGSFADLVTADKAATVSIAEVWADGEKVSKCKAFAGHLSRIDWPDWATKTANTGRALTATDFAISSELGCEMMHAALLRPFY